MQLSEQIKETYSLRQALSDYGISVPALKGKSAKLNCPFCGHDDKNASFTIFSDGNNFKCFSCSVCPEGSVIDFVANMDNISVKETMAKLAKKILPNTLLVKKVGFDWKNAKKLREHFYEDADGNEIIRKEIWVANGEKMATPYNITGIDRNYRNKAGLNGLKYPPYKLPLLLDTIANSNSNNNPVFIVEGEKDTETVIKLGLTATTTGSSTSPWPDSYINLFPLTFPIVILMDNDEAGKKSANDTALKFINHDHSNVKLINLADFEPKMGNKTDVSDWVELGHTVAELLEIVDKIQCLKKISHAADTVDTNNWIETLTRDDKGRVLKTPSNCMLILQNDVSLVGKFSFDMTVGTAFKSKGLPWSVGDDKYTCGDKKMMSDADFKGLYNYFHNIYGISNINVIDNAFAEFCMSIQHNPLIDYLNKLEWDGVHRVDTLLIDYLNAENNEYVREVSRKMLTALVRRAYNPGIKFDTCLILKGAQGIGKSTLFNILGGEWYTDAIQITNDPARTYESHRGKWLCELGELTSMKKTESERLKSFFSAQIDRYRPPYGKNVMEIPRGFITVGTTNSDEFLKDVTGNRRYWPVKVFDGGIKNVWKDLNKERDQILAEAKMIHMSGEPVHLSEEIEKMAFEMQQEFVIRDAWTDKVLNYLEILLPTNWTKMSKLERSIFIAENIDTSDGFIKRGRVSTEIIWSECLGGDVERLTPIVATRIREIMVNATGWIKHDKPMRISGYGLARGWTREEPQ